MPGSGLAGTRGIDSVATTTTSAAVSSPGTHLGYAAPPLVVVTSERGQAIGDRPLHASNLPYLHRNPAV
jgi:hypothetical protein